MWDPITYTSWLSFHMMHTQHFWIWGKNVFPTCMWTKRSQFPVLSLFVSPCCCPCWAGRAVTVYTAASISVQEEEGWTLTTFRCCLQANLYHTEMNLKIKPSPEIQSVKCVLTSWSGVIQPQDLLLLHILNTSARWVLLCGAVSGPASWFVCLFHDAGEI